MCGKKYPESMSNFMVSSQEGKAITISTLCSGVLAGLGAAIPMTLAMEVLHRSLPADERYPLPPREITDELVAQSGLSGQLDEGELVGLSLVSHFSYSAAAGALYAALAQKYTLSPLSGGIAFGFGLWAVSYLGWLPAAGILRPATEHPPRRTALMLTAHAVWGSVLGLLVDRFQERH
jgi:uncharacterized membrane protein YagU involved in acid resistance